MSHQNKVSIDLIQDYQTLIGFSSDMIIFFGLSGKRTISTSQHVYELSAAGILVINPFVHYRLECLEPGSLLALKVPQDILQMAGLEHSWIDCYAANDFLGEDKKYCQLRSLYAQIFQVYCKATNKNYSTVLLNTIHFLTFLSEDFSINLSMGTSLGNHKFDLDRYARILQYIHGHWREPLSLADIALQEHLSVGYMTRFFRKYAGITFTEYLSELRLKNAAYELSTHDASITDIAYDFGFRNVNSFISQFKKKYGVTPKKYQQSEQRRRIEVYTGAKTEPGEDCFATLIRYLPEDTAQTFSFKTQIEDIHISASFKSEKKALRHTWRRIVNVGYARDLLLEEIRERLKQAQSEIGFEYLRFHGIFDDDMHVYFETTQHQPFFNFAYVDMVLDFAIELDLKPFVELSFMPELLAKNKNVIFDRKSYFSIYNDLSKWKLLIQSFIRHCITRYGNGAVREWKFTTIGSAPFSFRFTTLDTYLEFFRETQKAVKEVDEQLSFGGPGGVASFLWERNGFSNFIEYAIEQRCVPDFICIQAYPHLTVEEDVDFLPLTLSQASSPAIISKDEHFTRTLLQDLKKRLTQYGLQKMPVWIEEWNSTLWQRDISGDTCYKAAWLVKNLCENYDEAESFGYWLLSDLLEERTDYSRVFHGGYGLFTLNGIPKSSWYAMRFLRMLGNVCIASGDGWMITKNGSDLQIILSHYCHYSDLYQFRYQALSDPYQAYSVFKEDGILQYQICLYDLPQGKYLMKQYSITKDHGSAFDRWLAMGAIDYPRPQEISYLKTVSLPACHEKYIDIQGRFQIHESLAEHEVKLYLLEKMG